MFPQESEIDAATSVGLNESFEITRQHVNLNINSGPARILANHGYGLRMRDDVDLEFRCADCIDREADAVDGDRPFGRDVPRQRRRNRNDDALRGTDYFHRDDLAYAVDVPRHDVPVERVAGFQWRLEIHASACGEPAQRRDGQRRSGHVRREAARGDGNSREANAVDGDAAAHRERCNGGGAELDDEPRVASGDRARCDPPDAFYQS